jgi:hypothetical protein
MFIAQIRNKLTRQEEQMEDLLTSNVFGLWRYLPAELGLLQLLETAKNCEGQGIPMPYEVAETHLDFWPWLREGASKGCEPDVLIDLVGSDGKKCLVLIEAKHLSGKSSIATNVTDEPLPTDQLAREMLNLRLLAQRNSADSHALVYVTSDAGLPIKDLSDAITELTDKTGVGSADQFYWTSWRVLPQILRAVELSARDPVEKKLVGDLRIILDQMGLDYFRGISSMGWSLGNQHWSFKQPSTTFSWAPLIVHPYVFRSTPLRFIWGRGGTRASFDWGWHVVK